MEIFDRIFFILFVKLKNGEFRAEFSCSASRSIFLAEVLEIFL